MILRDATESDLEAILSILNRVIATSTAVWVDEPLTLDDRRAWLAGQHANGFPVLVAIDEHGVAGYASFGEFRRWPGYRLTVEHSVHVREGNRRGGVGSALVKELLVRAAALGKHTMIGGIDGENEASLAFHRRLGFREAGRLTEVGTKFGRFVDLVFVERRVTEPTTTTTAP